MLRYVALINRGSPYRKCWASVDVAEYVNFRVLRLHSFEEFDATKMFSSSHSLIQNAEWRTMRDQNIESDGNLLPVLIGLRPARVPANVRSAWGCALKLASEARRRLRSQT
jgi:hypothetical protein